MKCSFSKIDKYVKCPFAYKIKYVDGNYPKLDSIFTALGTKIHECEENIAILISSNQPINYTALKNHLILEMVNLERQFPKNFYEVDKSFRTIPEKVYGYLSSGIYNLEQLMHDNPSYTIIGVELDFQVEFEEHIFTGKMDRVFYDSAQNKYIIQDIKTYPQPIDKSGLETPLQFVIYSLAAQKMFNCTEDQIECQYYLPFCELTQKASSNGYMARGTAQLSKLFDNIKEGEFTPSPGTLCNWCEFCAANPDSTPEWKYLCPYYSFYHRDTKDKHDIGRHKYEWLGWNNHNVIMEKYQKEIMAQYSPEKEVIDNGNGCS